MSVLLVALGAAVGAPVRFLVASRWDAAVPWGTFAVNVAGSFALGLLSALALDGAVLALLGTGFCGGLTTYSAFAVQTHRLGGEEGGAVRATAYAVGTLVLALGACAAGFALGAG